MVILPDNEKQQIIEEFQKRNRKQVALAIILLPLFIAFAIVSSKPDMLPCPLGSLFMLLCIFILLPAVVFSFMNYRCPACSAFLGDAINPSFCYRCKAQLREKVNISPLDPERDKVGFFTLDREAVRYQLQEVKLILILIAAGMVIGFFIVLFK